LADIRFTPPRSIPFQDEGILHAAVKGSVMVAWDTGTGKSGVALGVACLALQDGTEGVLLVCAQNKLREWLADVPLFTTGMTAALYHGPGRAKVLADLPDLLITTYQTARNDAAVKKGPASFSDGPLTAALAGRRMMVIYDEISELGHRTSAKYKIHFYLLKRLREREPAMRVIGLTATPMETGFSDIFSELRLIVPRAMPLVKEFDRNVIAYRDPNRYYAPVYNPKGITWFRDLAAPYIMRKRKTDPDVAREFPPFTEKFIVCQMHGDQKSLYRQLEDLAWDEDKNFVKVPGLAQMLYMLAGDPLAIREAARNGSSPLARVLADELGPELEKASSCKAEELVRQLGFICGNGHKALVFTFWGQSVLRALAERLAAFEVHEYHGSMTQAAREASKAAFRAAPGPAVLLSSDAGSTGINLPEASYIIEYEAGRTHKVRTQRAGRGHRLGSGTPVTMLTLVAEDTVEDANAVPRLLDRNQQQDYILGDTGSDGYVTAEDRREMFARARRRKI
jgi:superfamily II DNA or RNA helicase